MGIQAEYDYIQSKPSRGQIPMNQYAQSAASAAPQQSPVSGVLATHADTHRNSVEFAEVLASELEGLANDILGEGPTPIGAGVPPTDRPNTVTANTYANEFGARNSRLARALGRICDVKLRLQNAF